MSWRKLVPHLLRHDVQRMRRDPLLAFVFVYGFLVALMVRWGWPALERWLLVAHQLDWVPYRPLVVACVALLLGGFFLSMLVGFLLLEEREDGTIHALRVTPLPLRSYLLYRVSLPVVLSLAYTPLLVLLMGLGSPPWPVLVLVTVANAPLAGLGTLFFPAIARDKVQAFALAKILNLLTFMPVVAVFVAAPWKFLAGVFPATWTALALWASMRGEPWELLLAVGAVTTWASLIWVLRRFERVIAQG